MDVFRTKGQFIRISALVIAILIHVAIFNYFIFIFPTKPESFKPKLVFLGSILNPINEQATGRHEEYPHVTEIENITISDRQTNTKTSIEKPPHKIKPKSEEKMSLKIHFLETEMPPLKNKELEDLKSLGIEDLQPYHPIRAQTP